MILTDNRFSSIFALSHSINRLNRPGYSIGSFVEPTQSCRPFIENLPEQWADGNHPTGIITCDVLVL